MNTTIEQIRESFELRYARDHSEDIENARIVLDAASMLSGKARQQFARAYSFEAAIERGVYVGGGAMAAVNYPDLVAQFREIGTVRLFGRGEGFEKF